MDKKRKKELAKRGFKVVTVQEFLKLSDEEMELIEHRIKEDKLTTE